MEKTATLNLHVNPSGKKQAEHIKLPSNWKLLDTHKEIELSEKQIDQGKIKDAKDALLSVKAKHNL